MSDQFDRESEAFVRDRMERAGPRPAASNEDLDAVRDAARAAWRRRWSRPQTKGRWLVVAAAAAIAAAVLTVWFAARPRPVEAPVPAAASVARVEGSAFGGEQRRTLSAGDAIPKGTSIETGAGSRVSLTLGGISSLRIDAGSVVRIASSRLVELQRGAVYYDSTGGRVEMRVRTPAGEVVPTGTQFEARVDEAGTSVLVREGRVRLERPGGPLILSARDMVTVGRDGAVERTTIEADEARWAWAAIAAPMMEIEGRSLRQFLEWVARENGWNVRFADETWASRTGTITLHGSISDLTPATALRPVMLSTGVGYRIEQGTLVVGEPGVTVH